VAKEETLDPSDWEAMRSLGHRILDDTLDYLAALRDRPAWQHAPAQVKAHFAGPPPLQPQPADAVYEEYLRYVLPYQVGNNHPRFWGWVVGTGTVIGAYAELLAAATDGVSGAFSFVGNNYVELQVLDWCKSLLGYPATASGLLTSGCSASNLIALAVADVTAAQDAVVAAGGGTVGDLVSVDIPGVGRLSFVYATDPEGNVIELQQWSR